jgi:TatD DNase family protein
MAKKKRPAANEDDLHLPKHPSASPTSSAIVDTHTHLLSTFAAYRGKFPSGKYETVFDFAKGLYKGGESESQRHGVQSIVDVWCEAPVRKEWKELADSAITEEQRAQNWLGMEYHFVMGKHSVSFLCILNPYSYFPGVHP